MGVRDKYFGMSPRIARWKIDTSFENRLSYRADSSEFWKRVYVGYYRIFDRQYYKGGLKVIDRYLDDFSDELGGRSREFVARDMIYCLHRFGLSFQDYWIYGLIDKSPESRESFVADKLRYHYCDILNAPEILGLMTDKYSCYHAYREFFKREVLGCFSKEDIQDFTEFISRHKSFIYKPLAEHSGRGIELVQSSDIKPEEFFSEALSKGAFVVEELIIQGEEAARMHKECINSFRVVTFVQGNDVNIIGITWRIGVGKSVMDNAGAGGIYACVDPETGTVMTDARNYRGDHYAVHPDSGVKISGFKLPDWDEALSFIRKMATHRPGTTLISWDIAYSTKGWCMVEANDNGDWSIIQSNRQEGRKADLYALMDKYFQQISE